MRYLPLPWLSSRSGRSWFAAVPAPPGAGLEAPPPGGALVLKLRRVPCSILAGMPSTEPTTGDERRAWVVWADAFLAALIEDPQLTAKDVALLGPDRQGLVRAVLEAWHLLPGPDGQWANLGSATFLALVSTVAERSRRLPHELAGLTLDELAYDARIYAESARTRPDDVGLGFLRDG